MRDDHNNNAHPCPSCGVTCYGNMCRSCHATYAGRRNKFKDVGHHSAEQRKRRARRNGVLSVMAKDSYARPQPSLPRVAWLERPMVWVLEEEAVDGEAAE